jgi:hypothetical protein
MTCKMQTKFLVLCCIILVISIRKLYMVTKPTITFYKLSICTCTYIITFFILSYKIKFFFLYPQLAYLAIMHFTLPSKSMIPFLEFVIFPDSAFLTLDARTPHCTCPLLEMFYVPENLLGMSTSMF